MELTEEAVTPKRQKVTAQAMSGTAASNVMPGRSGGGYTRYVSQPENPQGPGNGYVPTSYLREHPDGDTPQTPQTPQTPRTPRTPQPRTSTPRLTSISGTRGTQTVETEEPTGTTGTGGSQRYSIDPAPIAEAYQLPDAPEINLPDATDQSAYIRSMYQASRDAEEARLRSAYEQNMADFDYQQGQLAGAYNAAADEAAAQSEINRMNFNNSAAGTGLNTGAAGQAALSQSNAQARNIANVRTAQANAQAQIQLERKKRTAAYQSAINEALANNDRDRAQALYSEAIRQDQAARQKAQLLAQYAQNIWGTQTQFGYNQWSAQQQQAYDEWALGQQMAYQDYARQRQQEAEDRARREQLAYQRWATRYNRKR